MGKRKETIDIENALENQTREKRIYGCSEVTIGFPAKGGGKEIVDFITMDSKGIIKCYEIKVTKADLASNAKKSWYGHFNYLIVTEELYEKINDWKQYLSEDVGLIVFGARTRGNPFVSRISAKKRNITTEIESMLKDSMVRSMYFKMEKYKDSVSIELQKEKNKEISRLKKENDSLRERARHAENIINTYETYKALNDGVDDVNLQLLAREEKEKYRNMLSRH